MQEKEESFFIEILEEELIAAMGCTEPVAVAYAAAVAKQTLGEVPDKVEAGICGNIIKNVKSVIVPNTDGLKGLEAAIAAGMLGGHPEKKLEVISEIPQNIKNQLIPYIKKTEMKITPIESEYKLDIDIRVYHEQHMAHVRICNYHTNIVVIEKDQKILFKKDMPQSLGEEKLQQKERQLSVENIVSFAAHTDMERIRALLERQIEYNFAIAQEGMENSYGGNIGKTFLKTFGNTVLCKAVAYAAAGSDARMNGCEKPVIILSGSGNQGITASVPVIIYAKELGVSQDKLLRGLLISDLITIHQKTEIGRLSAFCGAVCAGCGCACGIAYLLGADINAIKHTIVNTLAVSSGIICDGAKSSCAGKIALAVQTGLMGYYMYQNGQEYKAGDGIITAEVESTIMNIGRLGNKGMIETDKEILAMMTK